MHAVRSTKHVGARTRPNTVRPVSIPESSSRLDPMIGTLVNDRYRIQELIASGGMGRVYKATQETLGRAVAVKVVRNDDDDTAEDLMSSQQRLQQEAAILAKLHHPNIVTLLDFGEVDGAFHGRSFLAMELLEGRTLQQCLDVDRRLAPEHVVRIAEQIVRGLRFAHRRGIVHRDLKPSNIILVRDDEGEETVKLVDFGIGKMTDRGSAHPLTRTGAVMGTVGYIAPEQLHSKTSPASDLFALGVVLFEALTGRPPFAPEQTVKVDGLVEAAPRLRDVMPELALPPGLEPLVASLLARVPEERPTASDVLRQLAECKAPAGVTTAPLYGIDLPVVATPPALDAQPALRSRVWPAAMIAIVAYAIVLTVLFSRSSSPVNRPLEITSPAVAVSEPVAAPASAKVMVVAKPAATPTPVVTAERTPAPPPAPANVVMKIAETAPCSGARSARRDDDGVLDAFDRLAVPRALRRTKPAERRQDEIFAKDAARARDAASRLDSALYACRLSRFAKALRIRHIRSGDESESRRDSEDAEDVASLVQPDASWFRAELQSQFSPMGRISLPTCQVEQPYHVALRIPLAGRMLEVRVVGRVTMQVGAEIPPIESNRFDSARNHELPGGSRDETSSASLRLCGSRSPVAPGTM